MRPKSWPKIQKQSQYDADGEFGVVKITMVPYPFTPLVESCPGIVRPKRLHKYKVNSILGQTVRTYRRASGGRTYHSRNYEPSLGIMIITCCFSSSTPPSQLWPSLSQLQLLQSHVHDRSNQVGFLRSEQPCKRLDSVTSQLNG